MFITHNNAKFGGVDADVTRDEEPWKMASDRIHDEASDDDVEADWNPDMPSVALTSTLTLAMRGCVVGLPVHFLPLGRLLDLYWQSSLHLVPAPRSRASPVTGHFAGSGSGLGPDI